MIHVYLASMIMLATIPMLLLGSFSIFEQYQLSDMEIASWEKVYIDTRKKLLEQEVVNTINYIDFKRDQIKQAWHGNVQSRVSEIYRLVNTIYQERKDTDSEIAIMDLIATIVAAEPLNIMDVAHHLLISDEGLLLVNVNAFGIDDRYMFDFSDSYQVNDAALIIQAILDLMKESAEGFIYLNMSDDSDNHALYNYVGFAKYFKPLNMIIASGQYLDLMEDDLKREVLNRFANDYYSSEGDVIFVNYRDDSLFLTKYGQPIVESNFSKIQDAHHVDIHDKHLLAIENSKGGFVNYTIDVDTISENNKTTIPVIDFVQEYKDWGWIVGAHAVLDDLNEQMIVMKKYAKQIIDRQILQIIFVIAVIIVAALFTAKWLARRSASGFSCFEIFFNDASRSSIYIDQNKLPYSEFSRLADKANSMIDVRRRLEQQLSKRNADLEIENHQILNTVSEAIIGLDKKGKVSFVNPSVFTITGWYESDMLGRQLSDLNLFSVDEYSKIPECLTMPYYSYHDHIPCQSDTEIIRCRDDNLLSVSINCQPYSGGAVIVLRDVSDSLKREEQLRLAREEMEIQRQHMAHMERLSAMGEMAVSIAHEVNQPMTAVANYARVVKRLINRLMNGEPIDHDKLFELLNKLDTQVVRASDVVKTVKNFVKKPELGISIVNPNSVMREAISLVEVDSRVNNIAVHFEPQMNLPDIRMNVLQIQQVVLNFIRNAMDSTIESGDRKHGVLVTTILKNQHIYFNIIDYGVGVDPKYESRLFTPFFTTKKSGTGIGLSICRSIVRAHGGDTGFKCSDDGATVFYFYLPIRSCDSSNE